MVDTTLFERSTKAIELTAAGRLFKPYCERILKDIESDNVAIFELEGNRLAAAKLSDSSIQSM